MCGLKSSWLLPGEERAQLREREVRRAAQRDQRLLAGADGRRRRGDLCRDRQGYRLHTVQVAVQQTARADGEATDLDRLAEVEDVHVAVRQRDAAGEVVKARAAGGG